MVALIPVGGAFRDTISSLGLGLILCIFYRILRIVFGEKYQMIIVSDVLFFIGAGILYRAAVAGVFEGGTMRWYTVIGTLISYFACHYVFSKIIIVSAYYIKSVAMLPINLLSKYALNPLLKLIKPIIHNLSQKFAKNIEYKVKKRKRLLQNDGKMLYNS